MKGVWIEIVSVPIVDVLVVSLPVRGVWIEIPRRRCCIVPSLVAPREGSVD